MCIGTHPFIPVPNTARVRFVYTQYGQELMNVFHFTQAAPFTSADLIALNNSCLTEWTANVKGLVTHECTLDYIESTALDSSAGFQETLSVGVVGGHSGAGVTTSITLALKFASGLTGRSQRGRMYIVGIVGAAVTQDQIDPTSAAGLEAAWVAFFAAVNAATTSNQSVVSYCSGGVWRTTGVPTPITSIVLVDNNIDSQRRRLAGRGI